MLALRGWVASTESIRHVAVSVDGQLRTTIPLTQMRSDIDRLWPFSGNREKGWTTELDLSGLDAGPHELTIRALQAHGCLAELAVLSVTKLNANGQ